MKILIVDDGIINREKLRVILSSYGNCVAIDSGNTALRYFREAIEDSEPYNLITLDIMMPNMSGIRVLHDIREFERINKVRKEKKAVILMVTSSGEEGNVMNSIRGGCNGYIVKPFNKERIELELKKLGLINP